MLSAKEFLAKIENNEDVRGLFLIRINPIIAGINGNTIIWGHYPYEIIKIKFSLYGRLYIQCIIVNRLGTSVGTNKHDILSANKPEKFNFSKDLKFFESESEAINECNLRNLGKINEIESLASLASYFSYKVADIYY